MLSSTNLRAVILSIVLFAAFVFIWQMWVQS
jgi:hypothetical protein